MDNKYFTFMVAGIAKQGMEDYVKHFLTDLMTKSRKDDGCVAYNVHQSIENPQEFMLYSLWCDEESFEKHNQSVHMQEFKQQLHRELFDKESPKTYWNLLGNS